MRLNKLYLTLLADNPDWASAERRADVNHVMARLIFCFFAEDTGIIHPGHRFSGIVARMSASDSSETHEVIAELLRAIDTPTTHARQLDDRHRRAAGIKGWVDRLPYVDGQLFGGSLDVPRFSRLARA